MHPNKVQRDRVRALTDLPNIGRAMAADLELLGIHRPDELRGQCPYDMYERLCRLTDTRQDPCVIDVFLSITDFMAGNPPRVWWEFTEERKRSHRV